MCIHCKQLVGTVLGRTTAKTTERSKAVTDATHNEDSNSFAGTKVRASSSTVEFAQGCVTGFKDMNAWKSVEALMTNLTRSLLQPSSKQTASCSSCVLAVT